jgi:hypothetical protein
MLPNNRARELKKRGLEKKRKTISSKTGMGNDVEMTKQGIEMQDLTRDVLKEVSRVS